MSKKKISIEVDSEELSVLEKRAKKNFMTVQELIEDIIRRSSISYKKGTTTREIKVDDPIVAVFSRQNSGRKKKN